MNLGTLLKTIFNPILSALLFFISPVVGIGAALSSVVGFMMAALANPEGAINKFANSVIDKISVIFPSTPNNLKLGYLLDQSTSLVPAVGRGVISDIFVSISAMGAVVVIIKIYKLIPFKAT